MAPTKDAALLICIDMQTPFLGADNADQILAMVELCREARRLNRHIFLIEDTHGMRTEQRILEVVEGYDKLHTLSKSQWDGSLQVAMKCTELRIEPSSIDVGGAYDSQCVSATLIGMRDQWFPCTPITVHRNACVPAPTTGLRTSGWTTLASRLSVKVA